MHAYLPFPQMTFPNSKRSSRCRDLFACPASERANPPVSDAFLLPRNPPEVVVHLQHPSLEHLIQPPDVSNSTRTPSLPSLHYFSSRLSPLPYWLPLISFYPYCLLKYFPMNLLNDICKLCSPLPRLSISSTPFSGLRMKPLRAH